MNSIDIDHPCLNKAAAWTRSKYQIAENESIIEFFEQEFNCKVHISKRSGFVKKIQFNDEKSYLWFLIKWT